MPIRALIRDAAGVEYWLDFPNEKVLEIYKDLMRIEVLKIERVEEKEEAREEAETEKKERILRRAMDFYNKFTRFLNEMEKEGYTYYVTKEEGKTIIRIVDKETGARILEITVQAR